MDSSTVPFANVSNERTSRLAAFRGPLMGVAAVACCAAAFLAGHHTGSSSATAVEQGSVYKFAPPTSVANRATNARALRTAVFAEPEVAPTEGEPAVAVPAAPAFSIQSQAGVLSPTGFFDPLGLSSDKSEARLKYFQESETKHGRVAMLAALGFLVAESFHPLFGGSVDTPSYAAFQQTPLQTFWPAVVAALAVVETSGISTFKNPGEAMWTLKDDHQTGDIGFDPLGLKPKSDAELKNMKTKELQNGRLAMLGIAGMVAQELVDGKPIFGDAPVSAAEISQIAHEMANVMNQ